VKRYHMISAASFLKNNYLVFSKGAYSILIGVVGTALLVLFLTFLIESVQTLNFIPWIIAFNSAMTGYSLLDKTRDRLKRKEISSVCAGVLTVTISFIVLNLIFMLSNGEYLLTIWDLLLFLVLGGACSELGAILAIKYLNLKR
jgi:hypothetical protein